MRNQRDYLDILQSFKENIIEEELKAIDTISIIEENNARLSKNSTTYKESKNIIFREYIESHNSEELGYMIINTKGYDFINIGEYKNKINNKCGILTAIGENPVEILVYCIKGLNEERLFINAIKDVIKNIYISDEEFVVAGFRNILNSWSWNNCIDVVLECIQELNIVKLAEEVYSLLERRKHSREITVRTLFVLGAEDYYNDIINFLVAQKNESREELGILRDCVAYFGSLSESNSRILYNNYLKLSFSTEVGNILIAGIRRKINSEILEHADRALRNSQYDRYRVNKIIKLLSRCKDSLNKKPVEILENALRYSHLDRSRIEEAIGKGNLALQLEIAKNPTKAMRTRINAIISLAFYNDPAVDTVLKNVERESDILKVAVASCRVERGQINEIITLFSEIVKREEEDSVAIEATNQIRRLRSTNDKDLNQNLLKVATNLMNVDDRNSKNKVIKIMNLFTNGIPNEEIGKMFLNKLNTTHHVVIKNRILSFYSKNFNRFSSSLKLNIKNSIVNCTRDESVKLEAMKCLQSINTFADDAPVITN